MTHYDPQKHHRRSMRLKGYDYTQAGAYFVTLVAWQRSCLFGEIVNGVVRLSPVGMAVSAEWQKMGRRFPNIHFDTFVVMPNHVHGIVIIDPALAMARDGGEGGMAGDGRGDPAWAERDMAGSGPSPDGEHDGDDGSPRQSLAMACEGGEGTLDWGDPSRRGEDMAGAGRGDSTGADGDMAGIEPSPDRAREGNDGSPRQSMSRDRDDGSPRQSTTRDGSGRGDPAWADRDMAGREPSPDGERDRDDGSPRQTMPMARDCNDGSPRQSMARDRDDGSPPRSLATARDGDDGSPTRTLHTAFEDGEGPPRRPNGPPAGSLGAMIGQLKSRATKAIWALPGTERAPIWQRNYYDHIIRSQAELNRIRHYIETNPSCVWAGPACWQADQLHSEAPPNPFNRG